MNVLSDDERSRVLLLYDEGKGIREIERETGIHRDTISRHVGGFRSKRPMLACLDRMWTWLEGQGIDATDVDGYVDLQVLIYSCARHPRAIAFEDVDDTGCRFCIKDQLKENHRRHKEADHPIVPPVRQPADTYTSMRLPPDTTRRLFREECTQIQEAVRRGRVWTVPRAAWDAHRVRRRGEADKGGRPATGSVVWVDTSTKTTPKGVRVTGADGARRVVPVEPGTTPDEARALAPAIARAMRDGTPLEFLPASLVLSAPPEPEPPPPTRLEREASDAPAPQEREAAAAPATANARPATSAPPEPPLVLCMGEPEPHVRGLVEITYGRDEEAQREDPPAMSTPREAQAVVPLAPDRTAPAPDVRRAIATRAAVPTFAATPAPPVKTVRRAKPKAAAPEDDEELDAKPSVTAASANRKARANQNAQGLADGESRMRVCASIKCARSSDRVLGKFQSPAGVRCARCGTTATEGRVVQGAAAS